jgi:hypothetical protein
MKVKNIFLWAMALLVVVSCHQSDPEEVLGRNGDVIDFAGRKWDVKFSTVPVGPGPNYFSRLYDDVWVDAQGYLHLTIDKHNDIWYSSEVISQDTMGYGTYTFTIQADPLSFSENVVLGLFTWNDSSFYTDGNSEVDIEFSKWGDTSSTTVTTYSVQPVSFGSFFAERTREMMIPESQLKGVSTHQFTWTDTLITWRSYAGENTSSTPVASWSFNLNHPPRVKEEGGNLSQPIVIPRPQNNTHTRMNFWTLPFSGIGPNDGKKHEVVVRGFGYKAVN